jgi:hypothetical protein
VTDLRLRPTRAHRDTRLRAPRHALDVAGRPSGITVSTVDNAGPESRVIRKVEERMRPGGRVLCARREPWRKHVLLTAALVDG